MSQLVPVHPPSQPFGHVPLWKEHESLFKQWHLSVQFDPKVPFGHTGENYINKVLLTLVDISVWRYLCSMFIGCKNIGKFDRYGTYYADRCTKLWNHEYLARLNWIVLVTQVRILSQGYQINTPRHWLKIPAKQNKNNRSSFTKPNMREFMFRAKWPWRTRSRLKVTVLKCVFVRYYLLYSDNLWC